MLKKQEKIGTGHPGVYFKELHNEQAKDAIDRQYTERGQLQCQLLLLSLFSFTLTAGSHSVFFVLLLQDHEKYEILSFSLASLKTTGPCCSKDRQRYPSDKSLSTG